MYQTNYILKDCLQNMYDSNAELYQPKFRLSDPRQAKVMEEDHNNKTLIQHDAQHFIFGCGTDAEGELALQINVFLLTDMKWSTIMSTYTKEPGAGDALKDAIKAYMKLGIFGVLSASTRSIAHITITVLKRLKFNLTGQTLFPFSQTHKMLNMTIDEIRAKYNIKPYNQN